MDFPLSSSTGARTVLGSLTTTFTPAPSCFSLFQPLDDRGLFDTLPLPSVALQAVTCASDEFLTSDMVDDKNCFPPVTTSVSSDNGFLNQGLYSPGLICPSGYTTACSALPAKAKSTATLNGAENFHFVYSRLPSETAVGCCPRYVESAVPLTPSQCHY